MAFAADRAIALLADRCTVGHPNEALFSLQLQLESSGAVCATLCGLAGDTTACASARRRDCNVRHHWCVLLQQTCKQLSAGEATLCAQGHVCVISLGQHLRLTSSGGAQGKSALHVALLHQLLLTASLFVAAWIRGWPGAHVLWPDGF